MRSMEGVLEGLESVGWRAARRADLVPKIASAVGLAWQVFVDGPRQGGGGAVDASYGRGRASLRATCRPGAGLGSGLASRHALRRFTHAARAVSGSLWEAMMVTGSTSPRPRSRHAP